MRCSEIRRDVLYAPLLRDISQNVFLYLIKYVFNKHFCIKLVEASIIYTKKNKLGLELLCKIQQCLT